MEMEVLLFNLLKSEYVLIIKARTGIGCDSFQNSKPAGFDGETTEKLWM